MTLRAYVLLLLALSACQPPPAPPKTVDRFSAWIAGGCESEDECKDMIRQAKEHHSRCEADWACKATAADVKAANDAYLKFRERQKEAAAKKEAEKPDFGPAAPTHEAASKKPKEIDDSKLKHFDPPPPPGCWKNDDGSIGCPGEDEPTGKGTILIECGVGYGDKPPPGCLQPTPPPAKPKPK